MAVAPSQPLVFISASHKDTAWRDRLKAALETDGQTQWWDDSRIDPGSKWTDMIEQVIARASVAVVLLSPDYLSSPNAMPEFERLAARAASGLLTLFPIAVRDCDWKSVRQLQDVQIWAMGRPLDRLGQAAAEVEIKTIVEQIARIALETTSKAPRPNNARPEVWDIPFSNATRYVVTNANELATRSRRVGITSSCLLFGLTESAPLMADASDTARFVREVLDRTGHYQQALEAFMSDAGERPHRTDDAPMLEGVSANVRATLQSATAFAQQTTRKSEIYNRHLFAALLVTPQHGGQPGARLRLERAGIDLAALRREFRDFIGSGDDDQDAWDAILGSATTPASDAQQTAPANQVQEPAPPESVVAAADSYVSGPAGYTSEFVGVGGTRPVGDQLSVKGSAHRLAELIALQETTMPLAIGLFGDWGSGKSHFMNLMDRRLKALAQDGADGSWCKEIVPIYFNAWHYLDANLWASLVTEIFDGLFRHLQPKEDVLEIARAQLRAAGGATALVEEEVTRAKAEVTAASTALQDAQARSESARQTVRGLLDNLSTLLLPQLASPRVRARIEEWLGVRAEVATLSQLVEKHRDMASVPGRVRELWRRVTARGRWWRIGWLLGSLVVGPLLVRWAVEAIPYLQLLLGRWGPSVKIALEWIIGALTWLAPGFVAVQRHLREMETLQQQAENAQQARTADPVVVAAQQRVVQADATARAAESRLVDARAREQQLAQTVDDLLPTQRLSRFIEARARSADYRGQLGLVSLARRDFQELSDIFTDKQALAEKMTKLTAKDAADLKKLGASIDRIVLFVDDLDRCQPEKIVDVLQAVHLLLAYPLFAVVVGVDQRCLRQSLRTQFGGLLTGDRSDFGADGHAVAVEDDGRPATPLDYLEKIFHVPFHLPPMNKDGFADLMTELTKPADRESAAGAPAKAPAPDSATAANTTPTTAPQDGRASAVAGADTAPNVAAAPSVAPAHNAVVDASPQPPKTIGSVPLHEWERTALKDYHPLVRTPRGATRFLNTYRLLRAGIPETEWAAFRGDGATQGDFRIAMLLLASAAGHPAVARDWFRLLRAKAPHEVSPAEVDTDIAGWQQFSTVYTGTIEHLTPVPTRTSLAVWIERVEQFAF